MKIEFTNDEGDEVAISAHWAICHDCQGKGTRALHGIAITGDEWAEWDDEDREHYLRGHYDTLCQPCDGSGKVLEADEDHPLWAEYCRHEEEIAAMYRYEAMERAMGA